MMGVLGDEQSDYRFTVSFSFSLGELSHIRKGLLLLYQEETSINKQFQIIDLKDGIDFAHQNLQELIDDCVREKSEL